MSAIVLDTHVLVWFLNGERRLGPIARTSVADAAARGEAVFSAISAREISMFVAKGRLAFDRDVLTWLRRRHDCPVSASHRCL